MQQPQYYNQPQGYSPQQPQYQQPPMQGYPQQQPQQQQYQNNYQQQPQAQQQQQPNMWQGAATQLMMDPNTLQSLGQHAFESGQQYLDKNVAYRLKVAVIKAQSMDKLVKLANLLERLQFVRNQENRARFVSIQARCNISSSF